MTRSMRVSRLEPPKEARTTTGAETIHRLDAVRPPLGRRVSRWAGGVLDGAARRAVLSVLSGVEQGRIELVEGDRVHTFGQSTERLPGVARIEVHDPRFYTSVALGGILASGEAFMEGLWSCDDLALLVHILLQNEEARQRFDGPTVRLAKRARKVWESARANTKTGSRRNIEAHYDLGNAFFEAFLDPTLTYSCGIFDPADWSEASMEQASIAKYDRLCRVLGLGPGDHVVEVGCGWGGFAMHAAGHYGCRVTGTTISKEQLEFGRERIAAAGLSSRVDLVLEDYRELRGRYDKLVSIEMIEAVGAEYFDTYFEACSNLLAPHGAMALQAITIDDRHFEEARDTVDFIRRYIFPGGCLPSVGAIQSCADRVTDMRLLDDFDMTKHYAETLRRWRTRFLDNLELIETLGYPEVFQRMWLFYLGYCEGGFEEGRIGARQIVLGKPEFKQPALL